MLRLPRGSQAPRGRSLFRVLTASVTSLTWLSRRQLHVTLVDVGALGLRAASAVIPRFAKPLALDLAHSRPLVSLDLAACLQRLLLRTSKWFSKAYVLQRRRAATSAPAQEGESRLAAGIMVSLSASQGRASWPYRLPTLVGPGSPPGGAQTWPPLWN